MRPLVLMTPVLCLGLGLGLSAGAGVAHAQEYVLPSEEAAMHEKPHDPDEVHMVSVDAGRLQVVQIPVENLQHATIISAHPEVADIHVENPGMLFVFGRIPGQTIVVLTDKNKNPVYTTKVTVVVPEEPDGG